MANEELTFNELPSAMALVLRKVEDIENQLRILQTSLDNKRYAKENGHIPMSITEACEFLKMKRSTIYYHLENNNLPATRKGKSYILFKDELLKWAESGRTNHAPMTSDERESAIASNIFKRKY